MFNTHYFVGLRGFRFGTITVNLERHAPDRLLIADQSARRRTRNGARGIKTQQFLQPPDEARTELRVAVCRDDGRSERPEVTELPDL